MKLRVISQLEDAIDSETGWRNQELTTILFQAQEARTQKRPTALRAGVALLYAHWEGWIKQVAEYYIEFVAQQRLTYDQLSPPFFALALKGRLNELSESNAVSAHVKFADFLCADLSTPARFGKAGTIPTESNLSSRVLRNIITKLGLDYRPYELHENLIDQRMLRSRNRVAHGERLEIDLPEFETLQDEIRKMLRIFTSDVLNQAATNTYRR